MDREKAARAYGFATRQFIRRHRPWSVVGSMIDRIRARLAGERLRLLHCVYGIGFTGLVTVVGEVSPAYVTATHLALMYLLAVLVVAVRFGLWPALIASVASVAVLDFLFIPPLYSFTVNRPQDALLLVFLWVVALIASGLAAQLREQVRIADRNARTTAALYRFAGKLAGTLDLDAVIAAVVDQISAMLPYRAAIFLRGESPPAGLVTLPVRAAGEEIGVMTVAVPKDGVITSEENRLIEALTELAGIALGRQVLADRLAQLGIEKEADRLRSALLNSIAHDLTGPIASVATALTSLAGNYEQFDDATRRELIADAERETERLHQFSASLVHIARLEAGVTLEMRREPTDIGDLVGIAVARARAVLGSRQVVLDIPEGLPRPMLDFTLIEQAIFHVLENAGKHTPIEASVTISAELVGGGVCLKIADDGPGIAVEDTERIFAKFYRGQAATGSRGTGLGLAICRGFIEAHAGTITAKNRPGCRGAILTIFLPLR
jgi:two-component system sensor histidine kinase KdpD